MKKTCLLLLLTIIACFGLNAQSVPQKINYQAVARDANGDLMTNSSISVQISILSGSSTGPVAYSESHAVSTNAYGLFYFKIGEGSVLSGTMSGISWGSQDHFLNVLVNGDDLGTVQLVSVPYALQADNTSKISGTPVATGAPLNGQVLVFNGSLGAWEAQTGTGTAGSNSILTSTLEPAGANCANGGYLMQYGTDDDNSGILDASEVDGSYYVCNGADGAAGTNGTNGADGNTWTTGTGAPTGGVNAGDMYLDNTNGDYYSFDGSVWNLQGNLAASGDNWGSDVVNVSGSNISGDGTSGSPLVVTETTSTLVNNGDGTFTYTDELGTMTTFDTTAVGDNWGSDVVNVSGSNISGDGTSGSPLVVTETTSTLVNNGDGTFTYTDELGTMTTFDTTAVGDNWGSDVVNVSGSNISGDGTSGSPLVVTETTSTLVNNGDGTFTYTDELGTMTTFDTTAVGDNWGSDVVNVSGSNISGDGTSGSPLVVTETTSTLVNNGDGTFTYTDELGTMTTFDTTAVGDNWGSDVVNVSGSNISGDGTSGSPLVVTETTSTLVNNGDGTFTYTDELGTMTTFDTTAVGDNWGSDVVNVSGSNISGDGTSGSPLVVTETTSTLVNNGDGTFTYTDELGTMTTFDTTSSQTTTTLVDNLDGTFTYTSEDNTITTFDANIDDADADPTNEFQDISFTPAGDSIVITNGNGIQLSPVPPTVGQALIWSGANWEAQNTIDNDHQDLSFTPAGDSIVITNGNGIQLSPIPPTVGQALIWSGANWEAQNTIDNDHQDLSFTPAGDSIVITNGNGIQLSPIPPTIDQALVWDGSNWQAYDIDNDETNEFQDLSFTPAGDSIVITNGNGIQLSPVPPTIDQALVWDGSNWQAYDIDNDETNEFQDLSFTPAGDSIVITNGNGIQLSPIPPTVGQALIWSGANWEAQNTIDNDHQDLSFTPAGDSIVITNGNGIQLSPIPPTIDQALVWDGSNWQAYDIDNDETNEFQDLSFTPAGDSIVITNGNGIQLSPVPPTIDQALVWDGSNWQAYDIDNDETNEFQDLSFTPAGDSIVITNGNGIQLSPVPPTIDQALVWDGSNWQAYDIDNDETNEFQDLSFTPAGDSIVITNGNGIQLSPIPPTPGQVLTFNGSNWEAASAPTQNIYNSDGTLTGPRVVSQGANNITYVGGGTGPTAIYQNGSFLGASIRVESTGATQSASTQYYHGGSSIGSVSAGGVGLTIAGAGGGSPLTVNSSGNVGVGFMPTTYAKFNVQHTATQSNPSMNIRQTDGALSRIHFTNNTVANKFWEVAAQTNAADPSSGWSVNYYDGTNYHLNIVSYGNGKTAINGPGSNFPSGPNSSDFDVFGTTTLRDSLTINNGTGNPYSFPLADGAPNYVMQTNGAGVVSWIDPSLLTGSVTRIQDADADTYIELESSIDEDIIHFNLGDNTGYPALEYFRMTGPRLSVLNSGASVFLGEQAGANDDLSNNANVFVGFQSGLSNVAGEMNTAIGFSALRLNSSGSNNTAVGHNSLSSNSTGNNNVAFGAGAMASNTSGALNVAMGRQALNSNSTGANNISLGYQSLLSNTIGIQNIAIGSETMRTMGSGDNNVAIGYRAMYNRTGGGNNVAIGSFAGQLNATGTGNIFLGGSAGQNETGSNKLYIENSASSSPLIFGDFANDSVSVNGSLSVSDGLNYYTFPLTDGAPNYVMQTNGAGVVTWVDPLTLGGASLNWSVLGNAGTLPGTNYLGTSDLQDLSIATNATERIRVSSGGFVGVGVSNPLVKMHVASENDFNEVVSHAASSASSDHAGGFSAIRSRGTLASPAAVLTGDRLGKFGFNGYSSGYSNYMEGGYITVVAEEDFISTGSGSSMRFYTTPNGLTNSQEAMVISQSQRVGIGNPSPNNMLSIRTTNSDGFEMQTYGASNTNMMSYIHYGGSPGSPSATLGGNVIATSLYLGYGGTSDVEGARMEVLAEANYSASSAPTAMTFSTTPTGSTSSLERIRITSGGNLGVGTSIPSAKVDVNGDFNLRGQSSAPGVANSGDGKIYFDVSSGKFKVSENGSSWQDLVTPGGGDFYSNGSVPMTGQFLANPGSATAPGITFSGDSDNGIFRAAANQMGFTTGGTEAMRINTLGYVGMGVTSPNNRLEVAGAATFRFNGGGISRPGVTHFSIAHTATRNYLESAIGSTPQDVTLQAKSYTFTTGTSSLGEHGINVYIAEGGNVGLGTGTPNAQLTMNEGHIKSIQTTNPGGSNVGSTDMRGSFDVAGASGTTTINFIGNFASVPTVILTPICPSGALANQQVWINNVTTTGFSVSWMNGSNISSINYMVIE